MPHRNVEHLHAAPVSPSWTPDTQADKDAVREQLGRILSSTTFRNSRRFPPFLRYTVEHALGSGEPLKERTIGQEVFGREPRYDTALDPIVRMTAAEVRKRLAHYYQQQQHTAEMVISDQPGSYVPDFHSPHPVTLPATEVTAFSPSPPREWTRRSSDRWMARATVAALAILVVALVGTVPWRRAVPQNAADRFWSPLLTQPAPMLICIGDPLRARPQIEDGVDTEPNAEDLTVAEFLSSHSVRYTDAVSLGLLTGELRVRGKSFSVRRPGATELKDLREGPVVLIGGFNNPWTLRLSEGLRFTLATDDRGNYIRDRDRPTDRQWHLGTQDTRIKDVTQTYGLITRVQEPDTGQWVLAVSGLMLGTRAAAECLLDAGCLGSAESLGKAGRGGSDVQIVVSAAVIGEDSGAPQVVAVHTW